MKKNREKEPQKIWASFAQELKLTDEQLEKFQKYAQILEEWNENINLTAITNLGGVVRQHFLDSVAFQDFVDLTKTKLIVDVGTGAGFPALPLKILYPNLEVILIEVNKKKQKFLQALIQELDLQNVEVCDLDWRTFLRTTQANVDLFLTRAAIDEVELCRMFKPSCEYKNSTLVYWVADEWQVDPKAAEFLKETKNYKLGKKHRKLAFFRLD
ncbi:16S rRNA (guanine(527)-N(7))-methyltransferase RsmG [Candidatus Babeliales bacterium]|nr:16S rRNA (guanine(527)-N(7))-methyltransferase RsmG [Candidatus Babeliales bacterium]MCF7899236.1 16S rRNA (guanine(527)-N(7))-methyltransferase RsmG [Candidatus Babeliales bacterium]